MGRWHTEPAMLLRPEVVSTARFQRRARSVGDSTLNGFAFKRDHHAQECLTADTYIKFESAKAEAERPAAEPKQLHASFKVRL
jgi:hypothetical protein